MTVSRSLTVARPKNLINKEDSRHFGVKRAECRKKPFKALDSLAFL